MPQHPNLMARKHSNGLGTGVGDLGIEPAHQLATLFRQDASYLPPVRLDSLAANQPLSLEPVHQASDGWRPFHHSRGNFQSGKPRITGARQYAEYHVLLKGDPALLGDGTDPGARDVGGAPEGLKELRLTGRHDISFI